MSGKALRYSRGDAVVTVSETDIVAEAPATPAGFSELILLMAIVHEKWKVDIPMLDPHTQEPT